MPDLKNVVVSSGRSLLRLRLMALVEGIVVDSLRAPSTVWLDPTSVVDNLEDLSTVAVSSRIQR